MGLGAQTITDCLKRIAEAEDVLARVRFDLGSICDDGVTDEVAPPQLAKPPAPAKFDPISNWCAGVVPAAKPCQRNLQTEVKSSENYIITSQLVPTPVREADIREAGRGLLADCRRVSASTIDVEENKSDSREEEEEEEEDNKQESPVQTSGSTEPQKHLLHLDQIVLLKTMRAHINRGAMKSIALPKGCRLFPIFVPETNGQLAWSLCGFVLIIYEAFSLPFCMAFGVEPTGMFFAIASLIDLFFILDVLRCTRTGYNDEANNLVMEPRKIFWNYLTTWMVPDTVASIPWEWILVGNSSLDLTKALRVIRVTRLARMMRLRQIMSMDERLEKVLMLVHDNPIFGFLMGLLQVLFLLFSLTHLGACAWYSIGMRDTTESTWVEKHLAGVSTLAVKERYFYSVYFILTTMTTVGYGDIVAQNYVEICFVLGLLVVAAVVFAGLMSTLTELLGKLNSDANELASKKSMLSSYVTWRCLPNGLYMKLRQHLVFLWESNAGFDVYEEELKDELPPALRLELCHHIYGPVLTTAPFLYWLRGHHACLKQLASLVRSIFLSSGDDLFRVGQENVEIYMLLTGEVCMSQNNSLFRGSEGDNEDSSDDEHHVDLATAVKGTNRHSIGASVKPGMLGALKVLQKSSTTIFDSQKTDCSLHSAPPETEYKDGHHFDSEVLRSAHHKLKVLDKSEKRAARFMQRLWRQKRPQGWIEERFQTLGNQMKRRFPHGTVAAPAYFGESCLWVPFEEWASAEPPTYRYTAWCECRCEVVEVQRAAIKELIERFSPWLIDRFEYFREAVVDELSKHAFHRHDAKHDLGADEAVAQEGRLYMDWSSFAEPFVPESHESSAITSVHRNALLRAPPVAPSVSKKSSALTTPLEQSRRDGEGASRKHSLREPLLGTRLRW